MATFLVVAGVVALVAHHEVSARGPGGGGGGRGGGGGGGGGSRSAPAASRSPSVSGGGSRPSAAPSKPATNKPSTGTRPSTGTGAATRPATGTGSATRPATGTGVATRPATGAKPTAGQLNNFLDVPGPSAGTGAAARAGAGGAAADFLNDGAAARPAAGTADRAKAGERPNAENRQGRREEMAGNRPERIENRQEYQQNRQQRRDEVRDQVKDKYPRLDFWSDHPNWASWRINHPYGVATWAAITGWVGYGWGEASSYSYGEGVYYQDDGVYYGEEQVATAEEYADQAGAIAASAPETKPEQSEWLPLGVFALTQDGQKTGAEPTLFVQLAISKEGIISGTLSNKATNETQTLEGMADKKSQRAAWGVVGKQRPIMETGMSNLTKDAAPALVHFADGQTQQWLLVRLEEPKEK